MNVLLGNEEFLCSLSLIHISILPLFNVNTLLFEIMVTVYQCLPNSFDKDISKQWAIFQNQINFWLQKMKVLLMCRILHNLFHVFLTLIKIGHCFQATVLFLLVSHLVRIKSYKLLHVNFFIFKMRLVILTFCLGVFLCIKEKH
jgi:hypothetical protein